MSEFTAVVLGATGLVGRRILLQLVAAPECRAVVVLARRATGVVDPKVTEHVIDFEKPASWSDRVRGDVLFSALGTTIQQAGTKDAQYRVDYTYQLWAAQAAAKNGVRTCALISSQSASPGSLVFYSRMKGELERDVKALGFEHVVLVRPGLLVGEREKARAGERFASAILGILPTWLAPASLRLYRDDVVARATIRAATGEGTGVEIVAGKEIFRRAE